MIVFEFAIFYPFFEINIILTQCGFSPSIHHDIFKSIRFFLRPAFLNFVRISDMPEVSIWDREGKGESWFCCEEGSDCFDCSQNWLFFEFSSFVTWGTFNILLPLFHIWLIFCFRKLIITGHAQKTLNFYYITTLNVKERNYNKKNFVYW